MPTAKSSRKPLPEPAPALKPTVRKPLSEDTSFLLSRQVAWQIATSVKPITLTTRELDALFQQVPVLRQLAARADDLT